MNYFIFHPIPSDSEGMADAVRQGHREWNEATAPER